VQEPWADASGGLGELLTAVMARVAWMESQRRSEPVRAGLARHRALGLPVGRQPGARDRRPRRRSRYVARWERESESWPPSTEPRAG
jgi:DNA invertase Pin-like site-specific DNA recombinase